MMRRRNPAAMTDTPTFKRWFGQSKIVDAEGNPQRLYHITTGNFDVFKPGGFDPGMSGRAIWLTPYPHDIPAAHNTMDFGKKGLVYRSGASIMPLWARVENPLYILDADDAQYAERFKLDSFGFPATLSDKSIAAMKKAGHDGIVFGQWRSREGFDLATGRGVEVIVFDPTQIKSAIGNRGTFDPNDPRITHNPRRRTRTATRRNPKMEEYPCSRCGGTGRLSGYGHVWGGVCFKCHGTGTQTAKPSTKAAKWAVHFPKTVERSTAIDQGDDFVYIVSAKSPDQAVLKATTTFLGARIRHEFTERGAWAEPYEEYMARFYAE
jgi:hypothetical protein